MDLVFAAFATMMGLKDLALLFTASGLMLVAAAFCFAAAGDEDEP